MVVGNIHGRIVSAHGLKNADISGLSDPYCILEVDDQRIVRTPTVDNSLNPIWNVDFVMHVRGDDFQERELVFQIFDEDKFGKDDFLGEVRIDIQSIVTNASTSKTHVLQSRKSRADKVQGFITVEFQPFVESATPAPGASQWHVQNGRLLAGS